MNLKSWAYNYLVQEIRHSCLKFLIFEWKSNWITSIQNLQEKKWRQNLRECICQEIFALGKLNPQRQYTVKEHLSCHSEILHKNKQLHFKFGLGDKRYFQFFVSVVALDLFGFWNLKLSTIYNKKFMEKRLIIAKKRIIGQNQKEMKKDNLP